METCRCLHTIERHMVGRPALCADCPCTDYVPKWTMASAKELTNSDLVLTEDGYRVVASAWESLLHRGEITVAFYDGSILTYNRDCAPMLAVVKRESKSDAPSHCAMCGDVLAFDGFCRRCDGVGEHA